MATTSDVTVSTEAAETTSPPQGVGDASTTPRVPTPIQEQEASDAASATSREVSDGDSDGATVQDDGVNFHTDSDMMVRVTHEGTVTQFMVVSSSVVTASPIWRSMLYGNNARARSGKGLWIMNIDAEPKALSTLFNIIHYQFDKLPAELPLDDLFELTLLTYRYECTHLVYPWGRKWTVKFATYVGEEGHFENCHKAIWIAWELGDTKLFRDTIDAMIISSKVDSSGNLVNTSGKPLKDMVLPDGIFDLISTARTATIDKILAAIETAMAALTTGNRKSGVRYCKLGKNESECEAMLLGSAIPALVSHGLYPVPAASTFSESIAQLQDRIYSVKYIAFHGPEWMPHMTHENCSLRLRESVQKCLDEMPVPLEDHHVSHLEKQAAVSGILADFGVPENRTRVFKSGNTMVKDTWIDRGAKKSGKRSSPAARSSQSAQSGSTPTSAQSHHSGDDADHEIVSNGKTTKANKAVNGKMGNADKVINTKSTNT
ncbi:hypothetical protein DL768_009983 [Monosporascus sp. mg162]|nr:hypothetical protein DL768_009983 [Monosporascus sp. mg162]